MRRAITMVAIMCMTVLWPHAAQSSEATANRQVFAPSAEPFGTTQARWFSRYMEWLLEIPASSNPTVDPNSPRNCEPHGRVVFVAPAGTGDGCTIPEGKAIAFSPVLGECSTAEGDGETFRELRRCTIDLFATFAAPDISGLTFRIDGKRVTHPRRWIRVTPGEIIDFPDDNVIGVPAGRSKSVTKGFFFIVKPLDEGRHLIRVHLEDPFGPLNLFYPVTID